MDTIITEYRDLRIHQNTGDFQTLTKELMNKETMDKTHALLKEYVGEKHSMKHTKTFLSSFVIRYFPGEIFGEMDELNNKLREHTEVMNQSLITLMNNHDHYLLAEFLQNYISFIELFEQWKNMDKHPLLISLYSNYCELEEYRAIFNSAYNKDSDEIKPIITVIDEEIANMERIIKQIDPSGMNNLAKYREEHLSRRNIKERKICQNIEEIAKKAFWDSYKAELEESNHGRTIVMLGEIRDRFKKCVKNRGLFCEELDENIDTELLQQMIDHDAFNHTDFRNMLFYIIDKIRSIESPSDDADTDEWRTSLEDTIMSHNAYSEILPNVFKKVFEKLEKIEFDIKCFEEFIRGVN